MSRESLRTEFDPSESLEIAGSFGLPSSEQAHRSVISLVFTLQRFGALQFHSQSFPFLVIPTVPIMPTTVVRCTIDGCLEPAAYKVAAFWSDGSFTELKTYGFACCDHLGPVFRSAEERHRKAARNEGETVEEIAIYKFEQGKRDRHLQRLWGLEENYRTYSLERPRGDEI